jgi:hypothetical protein
MIQIQNTKTELTASHLAADVFLAVLVIDAGFFPQA